MWWKCEKSDSFESADACECKLRLSIFDRRISDGAKIRCHCKHIHSKERNRKKNCLPKYFTYWRALTLLFSLCSFHSPAHSNHIRKMLNQKSGLAVTSMIEKGRNIQFGSVFGQSTNRNECARKST